MSPLQRSKVRYFRQREIVSDRLLSFPESEKIRWKSNFESCGRYSFPFLEKKRKKIKENLAFYWLEVTVGSVPFISSFLRMEILNEMVKEEEEDYQLAHAFPYRFTSGPDTGVSRCHKSKRDKTRVACGVCRLGTLRPLQGRRRKTKNNCSRNTRNDSV